MSLIRSLLAKYNYEIDADNGIDEFKEEQRIEARKMEIYAGMIDNLDYNIGRLIQYLKEIGEYNNTLFVFLSDNGPDAFEFNETPDKHNPYPYMGTANSFIAYGPQWAHASSAVNSFYKGYSAEGGIHCPMIVKMPFQKEGNGIVTAFSTVMDLPPARSRNVGAKSMMVVNAETIPLPSF